MLCVIILIVHSTLSLFLLTNQRASLPTGNQCDNDWCKNVSLTTALARTVASPFVNAFRALAPVARSCANPKIGRGCANWTIVTGASLQPTLTSRNWEKPTMERIRAYAKRHAYAFVNASDKFAAFDRTFPWATTLDAIHMRKPYIIEDAMNASADGTNLVWLDTDVLITRPELTLEALIHDVPMDSDNLVFARDDEGLNAGVLFFRVTPFARALVREWVSLDGAEGITTDQKALRVLLLKRAGVDNSTGAFENARFGDRGHTPIGLHVPGVTEVPACRINAPLTLGASTWARDSWALHPFGWQSDRKHFCMRNVAETGSVPIECLV